MVPRRTQASRASESPFGEEVLYVYNDETMKPQKPCNYRDAFKEGKAGRLEEPLAKYLTVKDEYTIEDIYALPEGVRAELINGQLYYMATPTRTHQRLVGEMHLTVANYIRAHGGKCEVYIPPFAVYPFDDDKTYLEPDLTVICDTSKLDERGCHGAPDWVVEVISPSTGSKDMGIKKSKYQAAGVKEYWLIHPEKKVVIVYLFKEGEPEEAAIYSFDDTIPCSIYPDLSIRPSDLLWH